MKKLFVSLPMTGLTTEEIRNKMIKYKENAERIMGEKLELIDFKDLKVSMIEITIFTILIFFLMQKHFVPGMIELVK